jgi:hypothetical protein
VVAEVKVAQLQEALSRRGYPLVPDGQYGPVTRAAVLAALTDGADNPVTAADVEYAAQRLQVTPAHVWTVRDIESSGDPFIQGRPTLLFEPHRFSRATDHAFDFAWPSVSYQNWDRRKYPRTQTARYDQLLTAIGLNVDAGFSSASYGAFQILGENYGACGCPSPFAFAMAEAQSEGDQLLHFVSFLLATGLDRALRREDWAAFARGYNGTAYRKNRYDERLAARFEIRRAA